jgi:hypothetical protein
MAAPTTHDQDQSGNCVSARPNEYAAQLVNGLEGGWGNLNCN